VCLSISVLSGIGYLDEQLSPPILQVTINLLATAMPHRLVKSPSAQESSLQSTLPAVNHYLTFSCLSIADLGRMLAPVRICVSRVEPQTSCMVIRG